MPAAIAGPEQAAARSSISDPGRGVVLQVTYGGLMTYRDALALLDEGVELLDIPYGDAALIRATESATARIQSLPTVAEIGRYRPELILPTARAEGPRRLLVQSFDGDTPAARSALESAGGLVARFDSRGRYYVVTGPASLGAGLQDLPWVKKAVDLGALGSRGRHLRATVALPDGDDLLAVAVKTERVEQRAAAEGRTILSRWGRDGVLFFQFSDGAFGAVVPAAAESTVEFGTEPEDAPEFVLYDETGLMPEPFDGLYSSSTYLATHDTYITSVSPSSALGSQQGFLVGKYGGTQLGMIRTSGFYVNGTISNAQLEAYQESCTGGPSSVALEAHRISGGTWTETAATWNSYPAYQAATDYTLNFPGCPSNGWWPWDVTSTVQGWNAGTYANYGHLLKYPGSAATGSAIGYSSKETSSSRTPDYYVVYSTASCSYSLNSSSASHTSGSASGAVSITGSPSGCTGSWTASDDASWITLTGATSGSGPGTTSVSYSISANSSASSRTGHITFSSGQAFTITQDGLPACAYALSSTNGTAPAVGGGSSFFVTGTPSGCVGSWSATSNQSWLQLTPTSGSGSGSVQVYYSASENTGSVRTGTITVAGAGSFTVTQDAPNCGYSLSPTTASYGPGTGSGTVSVNGTPSGCPGSWTASSDVSWITLTGATSGTGSGTIPVSYSVSANSSTSTRTGHVNLSTGASLTVSQGGLTPCSFSMSASNGTAPQAGGSGSFSVTGSPSGCSGSWTATSSASWLVLTPSSGSGSGTVTVTYSASENLGAARTAVITVSGAGTFTVTQPGPVGCIYAMSSTSGSVSYGGGTGTFSVTATPTGCAGTWTATSNASWLTVSPTSGGSGSTTLTYMASGNSGAARTGSITVSGAGTFTVSQSAAPCSYEATPASASVSATGGPGSVSVSAPVSGCSGSWSATTDVSWLNLTGASTGSGPGPTTVAYSASANGTASTRTGHLNFSWGGTVTITQPPLSGCSYTFSPISATASYGDSSGAVSVTGSPAGCSGSWTATKDASWLTISPTSGSGPGTTSITYSIAANSASSVRTAHVTLSTGATFTLTQDGAPISSGGSLAIASGVLCSGQTITVPVTLSGSTRPLSLQFDVTFDSSLVSVTNVQVGALTTGFALSSNPTTGRVRVALASGTQASSSTGEVARITFQSLGGPPMGGSTAIGVENIQVNDVAGTGANATLSCSGRKGDVNGNGAVSAYDASLVLQAVVGAISLDAQQTYAADFNGNGSVTAYDASLILQCVVTGTCP